MAEEFPPLPSQLFGSPAQNTLPYLNAIKASQQGVAPTPAAVKLHACIEATFQDAALPSQELVFNSLGEPHHEVAHLLDESEAQLLDASPGDVQLHGFQGGLLCYSVAWQSYHLAARDGLLREGYHVCRFPPAQRRV